jgi:DNA-binding response OmpR family regulator
MTASTRILVIEDNANLAYGLRNNLEIEGYEVEVVADGRKGLDRARQLPPDLLVLDLMLPGLDGLSVLKALRADDLPILILVLTALGDERQKVQGLKLGADDYLTKPFSVVEFLARVEALLRRRGASGTPLKGAQRFGRIEVDPGSRSVWRDGVEVGLSPKEFDLLVALLRRGGAAASRRELLREVWKYPLAVSSRTLDTHVAELRRKLEEDPGSPRHILTVRKTGYRLAP